jgi:cellulose synthase/poly-beta-1,6-N-acetylglucosamine synthase-like glycosyltransferase/CheY-like chemotaxis protein
MNPEAVQEQLNATVLIVEDDFIQRELMAACLKMIGCQVLTAINGADALQHLNGVIPDLIICDLQMPQVGGLELLQALRASPDTESIPFIIVTARGTEEDKVAGFGLGADDYVVKPVSPKELQARARSKINRPPIPAAQMRQDRVTGVLSKQAFLEELGREIVRSRLWKEKGCVACIALHEQDLLDERLGRRVDAPIARQLIELVTLDSLPGEIVGRDLEGRVLLFIPEVSSEQIQRRLRRLAQRVARNNFVVGIELVRLTPVIGFAPIEAELTPQQLFHRAAAASAHAVLNLDLYPVEYESSMSEMVQEIQLKSQMMKKASVWPRLARHWRTAFQIGLTLFVGLFVPFLIYAFLSVNHLDITRPIYYGVVIALLATALLIWWESILALRRVDPPDAANDQYPAASAIIAAYLPNEAATIEATIQAFLRVDYPGPLQVILAYNTPRDLPIERVFAEIARQDVRFIPLRVKGSTSKAQNVNAALAHVQGVFVGVFDADHHPDPDSFKRAWRWLANGYDIVQGHCLVRNGDASWVSQTVAIEFEAIYAVSHPGRARLHQFGIFGGSNGFWKTDLLRETRMHSFMLTEDIDSSFRVIERGYKIASDPYLISRELAPTRLGTLWNQRMRWAQGWFQVALTRSLPLLRSPNLSVRQKLGVFHLLIWREIYPWIAIQIIPIILYWAWALGGFHRIDWFVPIFVVTTLVTLGTGPGQLIFIYRLADKAIQQHGKWFWWYLVISFFFYTEFKNVVGRVAQMKEIMGERVWKSTPRA